MPDDQGAKNSLSTWSPWSRTISQRLGRLLGFDGGTDMEACQAVRRALFCELGPAGTDHAIGIFSGHLDDAVLSDGDASAGERLDRADPWRRLEADIDRLRRFQFFGHFSVVLEDALAGERLLEPVEELGGGVDLVVILPLGKTVISWRYSASQGALAGIWICLKLGVTQSRCVYPRSLTSSASLRQGALSASPQRPTGER